MSSFSFATGVDKTLEDPLDKKRHPDFITLQRIEHELGTFRLMKLSVLAMIAFIIAKLVIHITDIASIEPERKTIDIILGTIELFGYALGLQAYASKSLLLSFIFQFFLLSSLGINIYYLITDSQHKMWALVAIEAIQVVLTLLVMSIIRRYLFLLKKRDQLKKGLKSTYEA